MDKKNHIEIKEEQLNLDFMDFMEPDENEEVRVLKKIPYKIIISDDDEEVHRMTKLVLKGFQMEGAGLVFLDAYKKSLQHLRIYSNIIPLLNS